MIEEGIVKLVQSDAAVQAICSDGGYFIQVPDGVKLPSWTYLIVSDVADYTLDGTSGYVKLRLQIDCYGEAERGADVIRLSRAINRVLSGYRGTLGDVDETVVFGCFRVDRRDFFNEAARNYRRMLEYAIDFSDTVLGQ